MSRYLSLLEKFGVDPNFFCSELYWQVIGAEEREENGISRVLLSDWDLLPPMSEGGFASFVNGNVWSDFANVPMLGGVPSFADFEYIYNPADFLNLSGGKWKVFRKNIHHFPRTVGAEDLLYIPYAPPSERWDSALTDLLMGWLEGFPAEEKIFDGEGLIEIAQNYPNRKVLQNRFTGDIYGLNAWDENYKYINYRLVATIKAPYLNEYMRYCFYTDPAILATKKLVNDGGCLGKANLEKFKDKLNPLRKRVVSHWVYNTEAEK